jgi:hypothetical protein
MVCYNFLEQMKHKLTKQQNIPSFFANIGENRFYIFKNKRACLIKYSKYSLFGAKKKWEKNKKFAHFSNCLCYVYRHFCLLL